MSVAVYVTGYSSATWDGPAGEGPLHASSAGEDIFVLKLNSSGTYQWHTFYGGVSPDVGRGLTLDSSGNVHVTGYSFATWNGPASKAPLHPHSGGPDPDVFILKLNSNGAYQWHTFYGSVSWDYGYGLAVDTGGNVYVTGYSRATWDGPSGQVPLHAYNGGYSDVLVLKLNSNGAYQWHTFYGSTGADMGYGVVVDASGNCVMVGSFSLFFFLFLLFCKHLPSVSMTEMKETAHHAG